MKKFFLLVLLAFCFCAFHPAHGEVEKAEYIGAWKIMKVIDDMDDSVRHVAFAIPASSSWHEITPKNSDSLPSICILFSDEARGRINIPGATFSIDEFGQNPFFKFRLDKEHPRLSKDWEGHYSGSLHLQNDVRHFVEELYDHNYFTLRTIDSKGRQYTIKFNIVGAREALKDIAKAAGWK